MPGFMWGTASVRTSVKTAVRQSSFSFIVHFIAARQEKLVKTALSGAATCEVIL